MSISVVCADDRKLLTDVEGYVRPYVPNIPRNGIEHALRQALIEFAQKTLILHRDVKLDVQKGVADYYIEEDDEECFYMMESLCYCGTTVYNYKSQNTCRCVCGYNFTMPEPGCIIICPVPECDIQEGLFVTYFAVPSREVCYIPPIIYKYYLEGVVNLAISNLLLTNGNEKLATKAGIYTQKAQRWITKAKSDGVFKNFVAGNQHMKAPKWL